MSECSNCQRTEERLRLIASVFERSREGILITDPSARILEVNDTFIRTTGYERAEVLGRTPALLKSGRQDAAFYRELWHQLAETGQWRGELWNRRKSGEIYPELLHITAVRQESGEVSHYVGMFTDLSDLKKAQQQLEILANYDALTELPGRALLAEFMRKAMANAQRCAHQIAICFLDLDDFRRVNDQYGHETGDRLLIEIGRRLLGTIRAGDTVARLGGDEFVLMLTDLNDPRDLDNIFNRVLRAVAQPLHAGGDELRLSASVGITLYPRDDSDPDRLLRHANQSMYEAKQQGRNRYQLFDPQLAHELHHRHQELERIREALQHGEFQLYYQPKANMRTGQVVGMEALIRWQHPERGLVPPLAFLPLVEQSPMIVEIGEWVLHEALGQLHQWAVAGCDLAVSVNIAARHFQHPEFVTRLRDILAAYPGVPPRWLELEILETAALANLDAMREVMLGCQALGVRFALDDFGTGYSSLAYLKQLPAETLKIDRSFVQNMLEDQEDLAIVEGVIGLASVFRKEVIAEGVETVEHGIVLMRCGCDHAQGYGIARPMPAAEVPDWVAGFQPDARWTDQNPSVEVNSPTRSSAAV